MKAGPKKAAELSPLPWRPKSSGGRQLALFCERFLKVPRGKGAGNKLRLRDWQVDLADSLYSNTTGIAVWVIPRGNGKSGLAAAIALHHVFCSGIAGARCVVVAQDERRAKALVKTCGDMIALSPDLSARAVIYQDRIEVPGVNATVVALPAEAHRVEGEDASLVILDEIGFMPADTYEAARFSVGKRGEAKLLAIGTPARGRWREISPLWNLVTLGRAGGTPGLVVREFGADSELPIDDPTTWAAANPAYGDWLTEENVRTELPPLTRESEFRRARLGQWVDAAVDPLVSPDDWKKAARPGVSIPLGTRVVLALDGSHSGDSTALLVGSVSSVPHFVVGGLWEPTEHGPGWRVPVLEVEDRIKELARSYNVVEVVADPFRWARTLQVLAEAGLPVSEFNQTPQRLTPATHDLRTALHNGLLTHSDEPKLNLHVLRTSVEETTRGVKIAKQTAGQKIDLSACLVMGFSRCEWLAGGGRKKRKIRGLKE